MKKLKLCLKIAALYPLFYILDILIALSTKTSLESNREYSRKKIKEIWNGRKKIVATDGKLPTCRCLELGVYGQLCDEPCLLAMRNKKALE